MSDVRWEGLTHQEIYARVQHGPGAAASADAEAAWATVESTIRTVDAQLSQAVAKIGVDWQGPAADGVRGGMNVMSNWALDAAGDALLTRDGIAAQAAAAGHVRAAMPPPHPELDTAVALVGASSYTGLGTNVGALEDRMAEDRAVAVDLMNRYTLDSSTNQQMMNYWTRPPSVVVETVAPGSATGAPPGRTVGSVAGTLAPAALAASPAAGFGAAARAAPGRRTPGDAPVSGPGAPIGQAGGVNPGTGAVPGRPTPARPAPGPAGSGAPPISTGPLISQPGRQTGRPPGTDVPTGGVRRVVPGIPPRPGPGVLDVPGSGSTTHPSGNPATGGRGPAVEPVPRTGTGGLPEPEGPQPRVPSGAGPRAIPGAPAEAVPHVAAPAEGLPVTRGPAAAGHGILPLGGVAVRPDQEHRRPGYLVDDTDAFADDRWFTPPVIGGDDLEVARG